mmetsp:Transcript_52616/g.162723  ORF Transcript_52616/g.162723 Transcript_52616/m.162723 type:complete len:94 (+) Transcript_52616:87-368(+)
MADMCQSLYFGFPVAFPTRPRDLKAEAAARMALANISADEAHRRYFIFAGFVSLSILLLVYEAASGIHSRWRFLCIIPNLLAVAFLNSARHGI